MQRLSKLLIALALVLPSAACSSKDKSAPTPGAPGSAEAEAESNPEPEQQLPAGAELLAAHVEAAGGADKIAQFETLHAVGKVDTGEQKLVGTMQMWWKKGGKFYLEQDVEGVGKSRAGYDGETIWIEDPITGLRILDGEEAESYIQTSLMFLGHDWKKHFEQAKTLGKKKIDGGEVWEVELVSKDGPNVVLGLDVDSKLIRYMKTTQVTLMGRLPIEAHTEDYEEIDGYKFAMKKRSSIKSLIELEEEITDFEVNVPIDDQMFVFPSKREQVPADPSEQAPVEAPTPDPAAPAASTRGEAAGDSKEK